MDKALLDLYADYLISSFSSTTATGFSTVLDEAISHDQITRFLAARPFTSADLWHLVKPLVRQVESVEGVFIVDERIEEKPSTDENDLITWHGDHSKDRAVKGINFLTTLSCVGEVSLPVAYELVTKTETVVDKKTGKPRKKSAVTKHERSRTMLQACRRNQIPCRFVLNDVWYASAENMTFVKHDLQQDFIMPLKTNRKVALSLADKQHGAYGTIESLGLEPGTVRVVYLEEVDFPVLLAKHGFTHEDGSTGVLSLVTSDLTLTAEQITSFYQTRWKVEQSHKSLKHNASLAKSPTRTVVTQSQHFFAAVCACIKLESLKRKTSLNHFALKSKIYLAALHTAFGELQRLAPTELGHPAPA